MARWLIRLSGQRTDLEEFTRSFPDGEAYGMEENGEFFLVGPAFEVLDNAEAVLAEARRRLDKLTAVISVLWPAVQKLTVSGVIREDQGNRHVTVFISAAASLRAKVNAVALGGVPQEPPQQTQAQELLEHATGRPHLEQALSVWGDPMSSWPRLYRILEEIELHLGKHVDKAGLCSGSQRTRFRRSAEVPETAGLDARHASEQFEPPPDPMTYEEANEFLRQMLLLVLR